jgi:hypothetical protein
MYWRTGQEPRFTNGGTTAENSRPEPSSEERYDPGPEPREEPDLEQFKNVRVFLMRQAVPVLWRQYCTEHSERVVRRRYNKTLRAICRGRLPER